MLFVYGPYMPLRWLEEIRFWKMQEREHTVVIRTIVPQLEPPFADALACWEPVLGDAERSADEWIRYLAAAPDTPAAGEQAEALMRVSIEQSEAFIRLLAVIRGQSAAVRTNPVAPVVIEHIVRESQYFIQVVSEAAGSALHGSVVDGLTGGSMAGKGAFDGTGNTGGVGGAGFGGTGHTGGLGGFGSSGATDSQGGSGGKVMLHGFGAEDRKHEFGDGVDRPLSDRIVPPGGHTLPPLPYPYNALEPHIDGETMRVHHDKHHKAYVDGLNNAENQLLRSRQTGSFELVKHWERELAFHGAGHYLHTLFWDAMSPNGGKPDGRLAEAIVRDFGSFGAFRKQFSSAAAAVEGSGWAILVWSPRSRRLELLTAEKHQNLSQWDVVPLLPLDVWEHAYYIKYRNDRAAYIEAWWNVVNWPYVQARFMDAQKLRWEPY